MSATVTQSANLIGIPDRVKDASGCSLWHCQVNEKSLPDTFPWRKAEGVGRAKILGLVKARNLL